RVLVDEQAPDATGWERSHLNECAGCQARFNRILADSRAGADLMGRLAPVASAPDPILAYRRMRAQRAPASARLSPSKGASVMNRFFGAPHRGALAGLVVVALLAVAIAVAPLGTLASDFLNQFRVQQFAAITIPVDMAQFQQHDGAKAGAPAEHTGDAAATGEHGPAEFNGMGAFTSTFTKDSSRKVGSVADANAHLGGTLLSPSSLPEGFASVQPQVYVSDAGTATYKMDVAKARQDLSGRGIDASGLPDPATTPDVTFTANIPASAALTYQAGDKHFLVGQMASPSLDIPSSVNVEVLRNALLAMPDLPQDVVAQIRSVRDWQHTLIIPVPKDAKTSQKTVHGAPALLISDEQGTVVLWQKGGILHGVGGQATPDDVMATANSLH
ncbi:hypothetical protein, partial [Nitrolancea hollandica]|uniref:hypothetical protein n=1 Tax=Nitrolancea hollandica TaxID=1206749 RepID=UPI000590917A